MAAPATDPSFLPARAAAASSAYSRGATACRAGLGRVEPFATTEEAWFWTMSALAARQHGGGSSGTRIPRPCDPDDVVKCLDTLYRRRRLDLVHARILRIWGERGRTPNPAYASERADWRLWREAMERLEWVLRVKGIVA